MDIIVYSVITSTLIIAERLLGRTHHILYAVSYYVIFLELLNNNPRKVKCYWLVVVGGDF